MRSLDAEHPAVALLERRLTLGGARSAPSRRRIDESGIREPRPEEASAAATGGLRRSGPRLALRSTTGRSRGLGVLSSTQSDEPAHGPGAAGRDLGELLDGPLAATAAFGRPDAGGASEPLERSAGERLGDLALDEPRRSAGYHARVHVLVRAPEPLPEPEPPSQQQEIAALLGQGDEAVRAGNRQQAIEIWSRIFLIDINNSEAVGRIEKARQEMAEGNRASPRASSADASVSRRATSRPPARLPGGPRPRRERRHRPLLLDRIEQELARPSSGLDLSKKAPQGDILAEEMADAAEPESPSSSSPSQRSAKEPKEARPKAPRAADGQAVRDGSRRLRCCSRSPSARTS